MKTLNPKNVKYIVVHCSATPEGKDYTVADIDRWHRTQNRWEMIGYHKVIYRDGSIHDGRPLDKVGAHVKNLNSCSVGVCYIGGCEATKRADGQFHAKDTRTPAQKASLIAVLRDMKAKFPGAQIRGHRDFAAKACPSYDATSEYADL